MVYLLIYEAFAKLVILPITLENGKQFIITAQNADEKNIYVQSCTLNGKPHNNNWFRHCDIADGAELAFVMGDTPTYWDANGMPPPSMSD